MNKIEMPATAPSIAVAPDVMQNVYDELKTPFKYGIVIRGDGGRAVDCPSVFRFGSQWFMLYVCMNDVGYETQLAESDNLLDWRPLGKVLSFGPASGGRNDGWDRWQAAGGIALMDHRWDG